MILLSTLAMAEPSPHPLLGNRLQADGVGFGAAVSANYVAGGDGGVAATTAVARWGAERFVVSARLPFASYRTPGARTTHIGNLRLDGAYRIAGENRVTLLGVTTHLQMGRAYTWTNDASSLWPGSGVDLVAQHRRGTKTAWLVRGALGIHGTEGFAPFPKTYVHSSVAFGIDHDISSALGVTSEAAFSWWDTSPIDLATWMRITPADDMRVRFGVLLPLGTWAGLSPSDKAAGVREATLNADLALSF